MMELHSTIDVHQTCPMPDQPVRRFQEVIKGYAQPYLLYNLCTELLAPSHPHTLREEYSLYSHISHSNYPQLQPRCILRNPVVRSVLDLIL